MTDEEFDNRPWPKEPMSQTYSDQAAIKRKGWIMKAYVLLLDEAPDVGTGWCCVNVRTRGPAFVQIENPVTGARRIFRQRKVAIWHSVLARSNMQMAKELNK